MICRSEKFLTLPRLELQLLGRTARGAIPTALPRLTIFGKEGNKSKFDSEGN
jgi:hypothetical protein